jgi:hypothetical protein
VYENKERWNFYYGQVKQQLFGVLHMFSGGTAIESNIKTAIDLRNPEDKGLGGLQSGTADDIRKPLRV